MIMLASMFTCINNIDALSLEETLTATYTNNQSIKASQQLFLREIEQFPQALADFLPNISAQIKTTNSKQKVDSSEFVTRKNPSSSVGPDVSRSITITQNIFSGGSSVLGLKVAQSKFWISRSTLYKAEQDMLGNAVEVYLNVCQARENYKIANDSWVFGKQSLEMVEEKLKVGEATITELSLAKANFASAEAQKSAQYANLISTYAQFRTITGLDPDENMELPKIAEGLPENKEALESIVNKSNLDLINAKYSKIQAEYSVKAAAAGLLPEASIQLSAEKDYYRPASHPSTGSSRQNSMSYSTALVVNIPIFSRGGVEYSNIRGQKKASRQAVYGLEYVERQIKAQIINLWESFMASKDSIYHVDQAVEAQTMALDGLRQQYSVGSATMLDVLKSQQDLNDSKARAIDTKKKYILNSYQLKDLMGQMTASQLKLNVKYFSPEQEFRRVKHKVIGF